MPVQADGMLHRPNVLPLGDRLKNVPHRPRRRHDGGVGPTDQLVVPRRVRHDVFEEHVVNLVPSRAEVFAFEHRPQIRDDRQVDAVVERLLHQRGGVLVAGVNHRHAVLAAEAGLRFRRGNQLGDFDDFLRRPAVGPAGDENHVGPEFADPLDLLVRLSTVVGGDDVHHNRPGPERGPFGTGGGHFRDDPGDHHLQPATGAGG